MALDSNIPHGDVTYDTIGAAMRIHSRLGPGLKEKHYQRGLIAELRKSGRKVEEEYFIELWDAPPTITLVQPQTTPAGQQAVGRIG